MPTLEMTFRQQYSQHASEKFASKQQHPVPATTPGFHPGTSPADYCNYCGTYLPAQVKLTLLPMDPSHVYQPGTFSQMMMILPQLQHPFPSSPPDMKGGYFVPGQYQLTTYVPTPQLYPVPPGSSGFYSGSIPGAYAGAYYSSQAQIMPQVQPGCVIMNAAVQQQQQKVQHITIKQECKPIRIRDPNQGGRDITDEIMSGGRSRSTPTGPQSAKSGSKTTAGAQANDEKVTVAAPASVLVTPDDPIPKTPEIIKREVLPKKSPPSYTDIKTPPSSPLDLPPSLDDTTLTNVINAPPREHTPTPPSTPEVPAYPAPLPDDVPTSAAQDRTETGEKSEAESESALLDAGFAPPSITDGASEVESVGLSITLSSSSQEEVPLETPNAQQDNLCLLQDPEVPASSSGDCDDSPIKLPALATSSGDCDDSPIELPAPATSSGDCDDSPIEFPGQLDVLEELCKSSASCLPQDSEAPATSTGECDNNPIVLSDTTQQLDNQLCVLPASQDSEAPATSTGECDDNSIVKSDIPWQSDTQLCLLPDPHNPEAHQPKVPTAMPFAQVAFTPIAQAIPALVTQASLSPVVQMTLASTAQPETPTPPDVHETIVQATVTSRARSETLENIAPVIPDESDTKMETSMPVDKVETPAVGGTMVTADAKEVATASPPPPADKEREDTPPPTTSSPVPGETSKQAAVSASKKKKKKKLKRKMKANGDVQDAFTEKVVETPPEPEPTSAPDTQAPTAPPAPEEADLTWKDKEDKIDVENIQSKDSKPAATVNKYQYKEEQLQPVIPKENKKYDRDFLLSLQFISASMNKPEDLPTIREIVLEKVTKMTLRQPDPSHLPNCDLSYFQPISQDRHGMGVGGGRGPPPGMGGGGGPPRYQQVTMRPEPRKIIMPLYEDVQLNKAEKAWKPSSKKPKLEEVVDPEAKTQELFKCVRSVLNKLTPERFQELVKQVMELPINTEYRLKGVIDLIFEKAISEPIFSVVNAKMCHHLQELEIKDRPGIIVRFKKLLLDRCQQEFKKHKDDDELFEKKQKELDATLREEDKQRLEEELDRDKRYSLGNIKFIGELFKLRMLTGKIMHDCVVQLLKNNDLSLECLCRLLETIGKDLDSLEKYRPQMDQYFIQIDKIIKQRKTSKQSQKIRFKLEDVLDLRRNLWVPRQRDHGPKTIAQIHKDAENEEHMKFPPPFSQKQSINVRTVGGGPGGRGPHTSYRGSFSQDQSWKSDPNKINNDFVPKRKTQFPDTLAPGGKCMWGNSWSRGSSDGTSVKMAEPDSESGNCLVTGTLNRFSAPQQPSLDTDKRVPQRNHGDRYDRFDRREDNQNDRNRLMKRSYYHDDCRERDRRGPASPVCHVANMTSGREREDRERDRGSRDKDCIREARPTPPPPQTPTKTALTEEELEKKATATIEEYLLINNMKEALDCVQEMNSAQLLFVLVQKGVEITLDRKDRDRENMGLLLHQLINAGTMPTQQYYKGLQEVLEEAEDRTYDCPHLLLYLAQLITPVLHEGGIPMGQLFNEITKPLLPLGKAGDLLVHIIIQLCKGISNIKVGAMWRDAGFSWKDFLPEDVDVIKFVTEKKVEFTLGDESESGKKEVMSTETSKQLHRKLHRNLDKLLQDKDFDWNEANLEEQQTSPNMFIRALMTCICRSAIISDNPHKVDIEINQRAKLLQKYLTDEQKELQALYALQALMVEMEQPRYLLLMFFDTLYNGDVIKEEAFYKWESSNDPAEQQGKSEALKSTTTFFTWLREAEVEDDHSSPLPSPPSGLQDRLAGFRH